MTSIIKRKRALAAPRLRAATVRQVEMVLPPKPRNYDLFESMGGQLKLLMDGLVERPEVIIVVVFAAVTTLSYLANSTDNILSKIFADLAQSSAALRPIMEWLGNRIVQVIGFFWYFAVFLAVSSKRRIFVLMIAVALLFLFRGTVLEHLVIATCLYTFFKVTDKNIRLIVVVVAIIAFYLGVFNVHMFDGHHNSTTTKSHAHHTRTSTIPPS